MIMLHTAYCARKKQPLPIPRPKREKPPCRSAKKSWTVSGRMLIFRNTTLCSRPSNAGQQIRTDISRQMHAGAACRRLESSFQREIFDHFVEFLLSRVGFRLTAGYVAL